MKVYIFGHFHPNSLPGKGINFFTKGSHHTGMVIQHKNKLYHCELDPTDDGKVPRQVIADYHVVEITTGLSAYVNNYNNSGQDIIRVYELPVDFTLKQTNAALNWWREKEKSKKKYRYIKLPFFIPTIPLTRILLKIYKKTGKQFFKEKIEKHHVCSIAIASCCKECLNYDIVPGIPESLEHPQIIVDHLKEHKVII